MEFSLNNPPALSMTPSNNNKIVPVYVFAERIEIVDHDDNIKYMINKAYKTDVPAGAVQATIKLSWWTKIDSVYLTVYLNEDKISLLDPFIKNVIPRNSNQYTFSFAVPDGTKALFMEWSGEVVGDEISVAFI